jgi:Tol biopolymer transport system component
VLLRTLIVTLLTEASGGAAGTAPPPILFAADNEPALSGDIFRLDANGHLTNLSKSPFADENPLVSPDGRRVAFVSERGGGPGIYEVGIDGAGLRRLDPPPHQIGRSALAPQLAWSPDGKRLAVVTGDSKTTLRILQPGRAPKVVERKAPIFGPSWSPDGTLLTAVTFSGSSEVVRAYNPSGAFAWQVPSAGFVAWSHRGLLTTIVKRSIKAYDEHGRLRFTARGRTAAWSPDGLRLASIAGGTLAIRTAGGQLFLRRQIRHLGDVIALAWMDNRRVLVFRYPHVAGVDTATGKAFTGSMRYFNGNRSADNRLVADTRRRGSRFAVQVERLPDGSTRVYGTLAGCMDDGALEPALSNLQFVPGRRSLVYESDCAAPPAALYAVNPDGTGLTRVTHEQKSETQPAWSPDGTRIAYARFPAVDDSCMGCPDSIVVTDADGSNTRVLITSSGDAAGVNRPTWSPDGTKLLFSLWNLSGPELYVIPATGGAPQSLHIQADTAAWGRSRIAYVDHSTEPASLWTALPDGSDKQKIAVGPLNPTLGDPVWSRDGRLACVVGRSVVVIVSGGTTRRVQLPFDGISSLDWSPDGTRFVVAGFRTGTAVTDIYTVRTDGTGLRRLTHNLRAYAASWR